MKLASYLYLDVFLKWFYLLTFLSKFKSKDYYVFFIYLFSVLASADLFNILSFFGNSKPDEIALGKSNIFISILKLIFIMR